MKSIPHISLPNTQLQVSSLCLGTADWGTPGHQTAAELYSAFREADGNVFDAAHCYAFWVNAEGQSEKTLGELVRQHDKREDVILCTKGCHITGGEKYPRPQRYMTPEILASDLNDSLERLATDYIDLYYLHRDDPQVPVDEIIDALCEHQTAGRIRYFAASNWRTNRLQQAFEYSQRKQISCFIASQILWNLGHLSHPMPLDICVMDENELTWYQQNQFPVFAFSATANGYFAKGSQSSYDNEISAKRRERALQLAQKYNATPNQIALAFLLCHVFPAIAITGTSNVNHLDDAIKSTNIKLSTEDVAWLRAES